MHNKIHLSKTDRKVAGVLGGIAEAYSIDSTLLRLLFVFVAIITGVVPAIVVYLVACIIIPPKN